MRTFKILLATPEYFLLPLIWLSLYWAMPTCLRVGGQEAMNCIKTLSGFAMLATFECFYRLHNWRE